MTDRELLEGAAKAADYEVKPHVNHRVASNLLFTLNGKNWNPLTDDGDALRLAVKLQIDVQYRFNSAIAFSPVQTQDVIREEFGVDPCAATRLAIVKIASAIGNTKGFTQNLHKFTQRQKTAV